MKPRSTLVLPMLFLMGLLALWIAEWARLPDAAERERRAGRLLPELLDVSEERVSRVEILGGDAPITLERRSGSWHLIGPIDARADGARVEGLLQGLKSLPIPAYAVPLEGDPARYGLEPPLRTIRVFRAGETEPLAALRVGATVRDGRYVQPVGSDKPEVVDALPLASIERGPEAWRERELTTLIGPQITSIEIDRAEGDASPYLQSRRIGGRWQILGPIRAPGDPHKFEALLADLADLRAVEGDEGFVADRVSDFTPYGLDKPNWRVRLAGPSGKDAEAIEIGKPVPDHPDRLFARRADETSVVAVPAKVVDSLGGDPHVFRSPQVAILDPESVVRLSIESGEFRHSLERTPSGWQVLEPERGTADDAIVGQLLAELATATARQLYAPGEVPSPGLEPPQAIITAWSSTTEVSEPIVRLLLGRRNRVGRTLYARADGDDVVLGLDVDDFTLPFDDRFAFNDHQILRTETGSARHIFLERHGQTMELAAPKDAPRNYTGWMLVRPVKAPADAESVALLDALLSNLRADRLVVDIPDSAQDYGLVDPWAVVRWGDADAGPTSSVRTLRIGDIATTSGARYAALDGKGVVFVLNPAAISIIEAELRDRRVIDSEAAQIQQIAIRRGPHGLELNRTPKPFTGGLEWTPGPGGELKGFDLSRVEEFVAALLGLKAQRYVQYEGDFPAEAGLERPELEITLKSRSRPEQIRLRLGAEAEGGLRYAATASGNSGPVFLLNTAGQSFWSTLLAKDREESSPEGMGQRELPTDPFAGGLP